jgi:hypothetical protein
MLAGAKKNERADEGDDPGWLKENHVRSFAFVSNAIQIDLGLTQIRETTGSHGKV